MTEFTPLRCSFCPKPAADKKRDGIPRCASCFENWR